VLLLVLEWDVFGGIAWSYYRVQGIMRRKLSFEYYDNFDHQFILLVETVSKIFPHQLLGR